jgi:alpha-tubulin suppressor-like RCC1 family protein
MSRCAVALTVCLSVALTAGCEVAPRRLGEQCDLNSDCTEPLVCRIGRCRRECATVRDCPPGQLCVPSQGLGICLLDDEARCTLSSDCPSPLVCLQGRCANECVGDRDCAAGAVCEIGAEGFGSCRDISAEERECARDSDCPDDRYCIAGRCGPGCLTDRDCPLGTFCRAGHCERHDAGALPSDAGQPDAGAGDAGPTDAGEHDAGAPDAGDIVGEPDAGRLPVDVCDVPGDCWAPDVLTADCVENRCVVTACEEHRGDCNGTFLDGCEVDHRSDPLHCGECNRSCGVHGLCAAAVCDGYASLDLGFHTTCMVRERGIALCTGRNDWGQLGLGFATAGTAEWGDPEPALRVSDARSVAAGYFTTCAVHADGSVSCWGRGDFGQIGDGRFTSRHAPVRVSSAPGLPDPAVDPVLQVAVAGDGHVTCARTASGSAYCWGFNSRGSVGDPTQLASAVSTPTLVVGLDEVVDISTGQETACAVRAGGEVLCWGSDMYGMLGDGPGSPDACGTQPCARTPTLVFGITDATQVSVGWHSACARHADGGVSCWGHNFAGALGVGSAVSTSDVPLRVDIADVAEVDVAYHVCARHADGRGSCWGENWDGQLGDGTFTDRFEPVEVLDLDTATHVSTEQGTSCARRSDGGPVCWGGWANILQWGAEGAMGPFTRATALTTFYP